MNKNANIVLRVLARAQVHPASPALVSGEGVITYGQLQTYVSAVAHHLANYGVSQGQVVGVSMAHNPMHVITLLALAQLGAISLPLHMAINAERRMLAAQRFGTKCVVSGRAEMALPGLPFVSLANVSLGGPELQGMPVADVEPNDPLRIMLSSGTSGDPKGMVYTHGLMADRIAGPDQRLSRFSRTLLSDLNFAAGYSQALRALAAGAVLVIAPSQAPADLLHILVSHAVTHAFLSPSQAQALCNEVPRNGVHCPTMACLRIGGGSMSPSLLNELIGKITTNVFVLYGSTEAGSVAQATPELLASKPHSAGPLSLGVQVEIVDESDSIAAPNVTGTLRIRTPYQVAGYFGDDPRNARHFRDGWFYPGDSGCIDERGYLTIQGRTDELLNIGGFIVNPVEVEEVVGSQNGVSQCAAFAWMQGADQEMLAVAIVPISGSALAGIEAAVRAQLGPLAPQQYFMVDALPQTLNGKLRRSQVAALIRDYQTI